MGVQQLVLTNNNKSLKLCFTDPLWGKSTNDQWITQTDKNVEIVSIMIFFFKKQTML